MRLHSSQHTINSCYLGYITQAIVNNFVPLLFVYFNSHLGISLGQLTFITSMNFIVQLSIDLVSAPIVNVLGTRKTMMASLLSSTIGFLCLAFLPYVLSSAYIGIIISVMFCAIGGGLLEVMISPIVESCPGDSKEKAMSLLHSFYCWGYLAVIIISTLFFKVFGLSHWRVMACLWAIVPLLDCIYFYFVPLYPIVEEGTQELSLGLLLKNKMFWVMVLLMICAGASEMGMSQWSSSFMETGLHISKEMGDLLGPASFALCMGIARLIYGKYGERIPLMNFIRISAVLCIVCYALAGFSSISVLALLSCALCGFSIGIFWPGTFSISAKQIPAGGVKMYSFLALAGDVGCSLGTSCVGLFAIAFHNNLRMGLGMMMFFPMLILLISILFLKEK